ncbi:hypothetical protein Baya_10546 [Bagarius yarrelli]|uniref:Uncharacterized protein n=1 Tax=Bagarius yarrelli TaxID=175774 RepID=A0A556UFR6_BAGYA|nr:hypothetical protein Baya_10546 [Bagarius yarrelli]
MLSASLCPVAPLAWNAAVTPSHKRAFQRDVGSTGVCVMLERLTPAADVRDVYSDVTIQRYADVGVPNKAGRMNEPVGSHQQRHDSDKRKYHNHTNVNGFTFHADAP